MASKILKEYYTKNQPLGPLKADSIDTPLLIKALLSKKNLIFNELGSNPSTIIGRRGAGKTAFLNLAYLNKKPQILVKILPDIAFPKIFKIVSKIIEKKGKVIVEEVCKLWDALFWNAIFVTIIKQYEKDNDDSNNFKIIKKYVNAMNPDNITIFGIMAAIMNFLKKIQNKNSELDLLETIERINFEGVEYLKVREAAIEFMKEKKLRAMILLDSLEHFDITDDVNEKAISGFLKSQGMFSNPMNRCTVRTCLPAELYKKFEKISSNGLKDFEHKMVLLWHARELLGLAAEKHHKYMELYHPEILKKIPNYDFTKRSDIMDYWEEFLPKTVTNRLFLEETSVAYILRHTQLLPRQLLLYLNDICKESHGVDILELKEHPELVVKSIYLNECSLCNEVLNAFQFTYPHAKEACEKTIPQLELTFELGDFHRIYNKVGKGLPGIYDFEAFKKMLIEIGAIGKIIGIKERYVIGEFEYTSPQELPTSHKDKYCIHPIFSATFRAKIRKDDPEMIYPYGTNIDGPDYRRLF